MALDPDVKFAYDAWKAGTWTAFDVCESIARQWGDRHVDDADHSGENINAHDPADVAVFCEAAAAVVAQGLKWAAQLAALKALL